MEKLSFSEIEKIGYGKAKKITDIMLTDLITYNIISKISDIDAQVYGQVCEQITDNIVEFLWKN
jgi:uncharacterized membrane protein YgcG